MDGDGIGLVYVALTISVYGIKKNAISEITAFYYPRRNVIPCSEEKNKIKNQLKQFTLRI